MGIGLDWIGAISVAAVTTRGGLPADLTFVDARDPMWERAGSGRRSDEGRQR